VSSLALSEYQWLLSSKLPSLCPSPCVSATIFLGLPFHGDAKAPNCSVKIYTKATVKVNQLVLDFPLVALLSELGGYMGLWLGVSVISITDAVAKLIGWTVKDQKK
jgi:hypothetical protein